MAGKIIADTIQTENSFLQLNVGTTRVATMNASGIYSNTGTKMIGYDGSIAANASIANTSITGVITGSQLASPLSISGNTNFDSGTLFVDATNNKVGIGTINPTAGLQIGDATVSTTNGIIFGKYTSSDETNLPAIRHGSSAGVGNDLVLGATSTSGNVRIFTGGADSSLDFGTTNNGERLRVDSSGRIQIGTTSSSPASLDTYGIVLGVDGAGGPYAGAAQFSTNGSSAILLNRGSDNGSTIAFRRSGTLVGYVSVTTTATAYNTSSDYRLKENIAPMTGALNKVTLLKPCTYTWKASQEDSQGFIAHELAEVVPDAVTGEKDAVDEEGNPVYQGIDTSFLVATLTAAIQEQQTIIEDLKARIEVLEAK